MISNFEIRARAREILGKNIFKGSWLYPVLIVFIIGAINGAVAATYVGPIIVTGILTIASVNYFVSLVRGQITPDAIGATVDGVKKNITATIIAGVLQTVFVTLGTILFIIPGIILAYSFSMVFYVLNDHPEMSAMEALKESMRLMKGHKMQFFCLGLSFIGWSIVGALCLGVGTLWVSVYSSTASAVFYEELVAADRGYFTVSEEAPAEEAREEETL
nr:DUF975 family protein [Oscillospiraceae bacterium]